MRHQRDAERVAALESEKGTGNQQQWHAPPPPQRQPEVQQARYAPEYARDVKEAPDYAREM